MEAGDILLRRGLLDERQLELSRRAQGDGTALLDAAVELGFLREEEALRTLGEEVGLEYVDLAETKIDLSLLKTFPQKLIYRESLFPIRRDNGCLVVATSDPFDLYPLDEVSAATGLSVTPVLAGRREINKLIKAHLGVGGETVDGLVQQQDDAGVELLDEIETDGSELSEMAQEASVIRLVNEILMEAMESRASDVHIESQAAGLVVRYRIDGMLHAPAGPSRDQPLSIGHHQPSEDHVPLEHRRETAASGRADEAEGGRTRDRCPRVGDPHDPRRRHRHAHPGQECHGLRAEPIGDGARHLPDVSRVDPDSSRHHPGHRSHGLRKDHHAVQFAVGDPQPRGQNHHHRGPGGVSAGRNQPDSNTAADRPDIRQFVAIHSAPRPGHRADR